MRRRLLILSVALIVGAGLLVATIPFWLGALLRSAGPSRGLTFGHYERVGYGRFALRDVEVRRPGVRVVVARAEADTPLLWAWKHWRKTDREIVAGDWRVEIEATNQPKDPNAPRGWIPLRSQLQRIGDALDKWLPNARTGAGVVRFPGGEISVASAKWARRELTAQGVAYRSFRVHANIVFGSDAELLRVAVRTPDGAAVPLAAKLESRGTEVAGNFSVLEQGGTLKATFAPTGWLPTAATLQARDWNVPGEKMKLGDLYAAVLGSAEIEWRAERFVADISARGQPQSGKPAPALELNLRGEGDTTAFTVQTLHAALPGLVAQLSAPVTIERSGKIRESAARFSFKADLTKQPWFTARGSAEGEARLVSALSAAPVVEFSAGGREISAHDLALNAINVRGRLEWPRITVSEATIIGGEGEHLTGHGAFDFKTKQLLDSVVEGEIRRASIARWLPKQPEFDVIRVQATASGDVAELNHSGRALVRAVKASGLHPVDVDVEWQGVGASIHDFQVAAQAKATRISAHGKVDRDALQLTALEFTQDGNPRLRLVAPATLRWKPNLQLTVLRLTGPEGELLLSGDGGETGRVEVSGKNISSRWLADLVPMPGPAWQLTLLALIGAWDRGPMQFSLSAGASLEIGEGRSASVMAAARGDKDGVRIEALRASEGDSTVVNATGRVAATVTPGAASLLHIDATGPLALDATVAPNSAFWQKLAAASGIELKDPEASAHVTGTWQRPEGRVRLKAARIAIDPKRVTRPLPTMEALDIEVTGDRGGLNLGTCTVNIEGQTVRAQGGLPIPDGAWSRLFKEPLAAAKQGADLRLEIPDADVAVFTRFLPAVLAPKGRLQADVHYKNGGLEGFLKLRDAASKPLGPLGVLQEISADIALSGRKLALRGVTARSGGQPVTLSGTVEFPETGDPRFDLALRGENLPFVRQTGLLLRGDLDLKLQTPEKAMPRLSGNVKLRDSLFLSDVRSFLPKGGGTSPSRRPPYFAIDTAPVNSWGLAIEVEGNEFMRLRTPVFAGVASAHFRLGGTLGEPRAIGEISLDEGKVRMPFASFSVTQGSVRLTEANPYEPEIYLRGTGRRYGYDLTMEIEGQATQPNVVFMSSPALDSEQVLLMVMTGAAPSNEVNKSATQRVANIGYFLGSSLLGSLSADAGDPDRLTIASGENVSGNGEETYDIEYKLTDRWTVTAEKNEFAEWNFGAKWRIFRDKRGGERSAEHAKK